MSKPLLLLDVDGVLNLFPLLSLPEIPDNLLSGKFTQDFTTYRLLWRDDLPDTIAKLREHFDIVWATTWEHDANYKWLPAMGLTEPLPVITLVPLRREAMLTLPSHICWKTPIIAQWLKDVALEREDTRGVWLDDDAFEVNDNDLLPEGFSCFHVDPRTGLTPELADQIIEQFGK